MARNWTHNRTRDLSLLLAIVLFVFSSTAQPQRKFSGWYEADKPALLFPPEAKIAILREQAKKYQRAGIKISFIRTVQRIVASSPGDPRVLGSAVNLLIEYGDQSDCDLAVDLTTGFMARNSPVASVFSDRSSARSCLRDYVGAFQDLTLALGIAPDDFDLMHNRLRVLYSVDPSIALELYRVAIEECERDKVRNPVLLHRYGNVLANAYRGRSEAQRKLGNKAAWLSDLTKAIESWPSKSSPYYFDRSIAYREEKMYDEAITDINRYIQYLSETRRLSYLDYVYRAVLLEEAGRYSDAISDYLIAAEKAPQNKLAYKRRIEELERKLR